MHLTIWARKAAEDWGRTERCCLSRVLATGLLLLLLTGVGWGQSEDSFDKLPVFSEALSIIKDQYVEPRDIKNLIYGSIRGVVGTLDSHSSFMTPEEFRELQIETRGQFSGIGIEITMKDSLLIVVSPIEGTPAYRAGIQAGDRIVKINGASTKNLSLMEAVKKIRGPKGSRVTLTIMREGLKAPKNYTLTRDIIPIRSVKARYLDEGIGYIRITNFQDQTEKDLQKAIKALQTRLKPFQGLILDLRNDPGGLLDQAVRVADEFLAKGLIVYTEGRDNSQLMRFYAEPGSGNGAESFPLVVLINEGSASASEIVAGAVQDHKRGLIIGTKSFGKGSVQTIVPLEDGSALKLTTAHYFTPLGHSIQDKGIIPDLVVEATPIPEGKSLEALRQQALERRMQKKGLTDKPWTAPISPEELKEDPQLQQAVEVLKDWPPPKLVAKVKEQNSSPSSSPK
ncbi:MAG: S41 family peptidase [Deltaproteobacteria bacterium]|nr:S41 family peptidase [Deltaproteobacteria bacterium]MBW1952998.1 S41 family peptidase [Deltaproteobacteria bacterium]MBW1985943.1 S41 family peptidase [Deltaproteobacteria bacterium]MBW2133703.1 S41 family peptidase [Deltaproteobacteria bacterium]